MKIEILRSQDRILITTTQDETIWLNFEDAYSLAKMLVAFFPH